MLSLYWKGCAFRYEKSDVSQEKFGKGNNFFNYILFLIHDLVIGMLHLRQGRQPYNFVYSI